MEPFGLDAWGVVLRLALGVGVGFCIGLTGVGGGILGLQSMTLVLQMDPVVSVGTTGLYVFLTKIFAGIEHARLGNIAWKPAVGLLIGAVPANIATSYWISNHGGDVVFSEALRSFICIVILFSAGVMMVDLVASLRRRGECGERNLSARMMDGYGIVQAMSTLLSGALIGGLVGATSVGGGVLLVPMLIILFGLNARRTVGTSIFIALLLTLVTALVYGRSGEVEVSTAGVMAFGSLFGVRLGTRLSVRIPEFGLRATMVGVILAAVVMLLG